MSGIGFMTEYSILLWVWWLVHKNIYYLILHHQEFQLISLLCHQNDVERLTCQWAYNIHSSGKGQHSPDLWYIDTFLARSILSMFLKHCSIKSTLSGETTLSNFSSSTATSRKFCYTDKEEMNMKRKYDLLLEVKWILLPKNPPPTVWTRIVTV